MGAYRAVLITSVMLTTAAVRVAFANGAPPRQASSVAQLCDAARTYASNSPGKVSTFSIVPFGDDPDAVEGAWREFPDIARRDKLAETRPI